MNLETWVLHALDRRIVCRRCHVVMRDLEPNTFNGEFHHSRQFGDLKPNPCKNSGKAFTIRDLCGREVEPYMRKRERRRRARS